jgi:transcriptional regulator with XRE-family HTH domain
MTTFRIGPKLSRISDTDRTRTPSGPSGDRRQAFADFVRAALADARAAHGWNGSEVARQTGLSRQTINRWRRGEWSSDPEPARVVTFCEKLGIDPDTAFANLGWHQAAAVPPAEPPMDPDVAALLRRLVDPAVSDYEKYHMRETIRYLAYRNPG